MKNTIVTKTGDDGKTYLFGAGIRVKKNHIRVQCYGDIDELNSLLGLIISQSSLALINNLLLEIQNQLFELGSDVAIPSKLYKDQFTKEKKTLFLAFISGLENQIESIEQNLPELKNFILPGGSLEASFLHLARTVCRRVERKCSELIPDDLNESVLIYFNRLSDLFFILARNANSLKKVNESIWMSKLSKKIN